MTLIVVGNIDARPSPSRSIKRSVPLKGKRETPAPVPTLRRCGRISEHYDRCGAPDRLSIMGYAVANRSSRVGGAAALPVRDLAREALFWHIQQEFTKITLKRYWSGGLTAGFCVPARAVRHQH